MSSAFWTGAAVLTGALGGLTFLSLHTLIEGTPFPFRSTSFLWVFGAATIVMSAKLTYERVRAAGTALAALCLVAFVWMGWEERQYNRWHADWQRETRDLAQSTPEGTEVVAVYGTHVLPGGFPGYRGQMVKTLESRLIFQMVRPVVMCSAPSSPCEIFDPPFDPSKLPDEISVTTVDKVTFIRLPMREWPGAN